MKHQIDDNTYEKFLVDLRLLPRTNAEIAEILGIDKSNITNYRNRTHWPGVKTVRRFYEKFAEELRGVEKSRKGDTSSENLTNGNVQNPKQKYQADALEANTVELKKLGEDIRDIKDLLLKALGINPNQINGEGSGK